MVARVFITLLLLFPAALLAQTPPAPTWYLIAPESQTITVTLPAGVTCRLGDVLNAKWTQFTTTTAPMTLGGVTFLCTQGQIFTDGTAGMSCVIQ